MTDRDRDGDPPGWDPAHVESADLRSGRRAEIVRAYSALKAAGRDDLAEDLRYTRPSRRTLLSQKYLAEIDDADADGGSSE